MQHPEILKREIKAIAFDQYGTIVDMQAGLVAAVTPFLRQKGWQGEPNSSSPGGAAPTSRAR